MISTFKSRTRASPASATLPARNTGTAAATMRRSATVAAEEKEVQVNLQLQIKRIGFTREKIH